MVDRRYWKYTAYRGGRNVYFHPGGIGMLVGGYNGCYDYFSYPVNSLPETALLCENGEIILAAGTVGSWSTGESADEIIVEEPGFYHISC
jgi:hypothetical protein